MAIVTTPLGFQKPDGNEPVRNGDNVIAANGAKAEELHQDARGRLTAIESKNAAQDGRLTVVESKNATQDARLANLDNAAGFTGDPLALNDAAFAETLTNGTATSAALDTRLTVRVPPIVAAAIASDPTVASSAATMAQNTAGLVPVWKASTAYVAGQRVIAPNGDVVSAKVNFTSTAAYSATNWNASTQDARVGALEVRTTTQNLGTTDLDTIKAAGVYGQNTTGNATTASHYPEASRGSLYVEQVSGLSTLTQRYTASFTQNVYVREFYSSAWGPWKRQTPGATTNLTTEDLNTLNTAGTYVQNTAGNATVGRNYPVAARGYLTVTQVSSTSTVVQVFTASSAGEIWMREYYASAWGAWSRPGGASAGFDPRLANAEAAISTAQADITVLNGEQDAQDGRLGVLEAQTGLSNPVTGAQVDGDGLLTFTLADASVTNGVPIPAQLPTDQVDYIEQMRRRSTYATMELKKIDSLGRVEVSCVAPSGKHVTYEFKGASAGPTDDDYRMQQRIWVGDSTGAVRNKTTLLGPSSNRDFAFQITPTGSGFPATFMPDHGDPTAFNIEAPQLYHGGTLIDVAAMTTGQVLPLTGRFDLVQHVMGRHPSAPSTDLLEMWTTHTIHPDGVLSTDGRFRVVTPTTLGAAYVIMAPVAADIIDTVVTSLNNAYPNNAGLVGTNTFLPEADVATSYAFLSSTNRDVGAAVRYNNPAETIRRGQADKLASGERTWLEHRAGGLILKLYQRPWSNPLDLPVGFTHRFSGDYLYMGAPDLYDLLAL